MPGDYLYMDAIGRRFRQGAWGIIRVLPGLTAQPAAIAGSRRAQLEHSRCPQRPADGRRSRTIRAIPVRPWHRSAGSTSARSTSRRARSATSCARPSCRATSPRSSRRSGSRRAARDARRGGTCITVHFSNRRTVRASFHSGLLSASANGNTAYGSASSGVDVGFGPEQTVAPGGSRDYRLYADAKLGATLISDFGGPAVASQPAESPPTSTPGRSACTARWSAPGRRNLRRAPSEARSASDAGRRARTGGWVVSRLHRPDAG